jgi:CheY-like chemotaxis protein
VSSADEALPFVRDARPDVIVSDMAMPNGDGYDLIRRIRALSPDQGGCTLAVALTRLARAEERTRALVAGYNMNVPKPVEPAELLSTVANLLANFR